MKLILQLTVIAAAVSLVACGGSSSKPGETAELATPSEFVQKVASCETGDTPETALQGQVPAALRTSGFKGFNCKLQLAGQSRGNGGSFATATYTDRSGRRCAYYGTGGPGPGFNADLLTPGVPVVDITDSARPVQTTILNTPGMNIVHEGLRANANRGILAAARLQGSFFDVYDLSQDCSSPQLMSSAEVGTGTDGGIAPPNPPLGHEGNFSTDGLTYYVGDTQGATPSYHAIDLSNMARPRLVSSWSLPGAGLADPARFGSYITHGLSVSSDGNRMYATITTSPKSLADVSNPDPALVANGFLIFDSSEVQARLPNAKLKLIKHVAYKDGSVAQHTLPIKVAGKKFLVQVDEGGAAGISFPPAVDAACQAKLAPFPMARIYSIEDEKNPSLISKLGLETHDTNNCAQIKPDLAGPGAPFYYGSHYCSVDNRENATVLACSYFESGIRVFDIRNPAVPREIAYFNPPSAPNKGSGSFHGLWFQPGHPDWCGSRLDFDFDRKELITMCQDNGLLLMRFTGKDNWPFPQSTKASQQD